MKKIRVLFCCLGNICRSPTAHGIFEHFVEQHDLTAQIEIDSAGTGDWHIGKAPDPRSAAAALARGYALDHLRARQVAPADFDRFDYVLAMDRQNLADLEAMRPVSFAGELDLFLRYDPEAELEEVPDPYYGGEQGFQHVLDLIERASAGLLNHLVERHQLRLKS